MPGRDGTGPLGGGAGTGRGMGRGGGRGRMGGNLPGSGPGGSCLCPNCNLSVPHIAGAPCNQAKCPKCGAVMVKG
jgi:hypothetical protein